MTDSSLYFPYKSVGIVTDGKPFVINRLGDEVFLVTSIGNYFQVYRFDKLLVCLVSQQCAGEITCLQVKGHETFVAIENKIVVYNRTRIVRTYEEHDADIINMCMVGDMLFSFDTDNHMKIIDTKERSLVANMTSIEASGGNISAVVHPATYLNKFLVGYTTGALELWNVRKQKLIYKFTAHANTFRELREEQQQDHADMFGGGGSSNLGGDKSTSSGVVPEVTCMEQSPAVDVMGVGFADGHILLINLKLDKVLFAFKQEGGKVTSLSFRSDKAAQQFPYLASSSADGRVHVWNLGTKDTGDDDGDGDGDDSDMDLDVDLETREGGRRKGPTIVNRKLQFSIDNAHLAECSRVHFLHGEPIMVSASHDNSIKVWIYDTPDGTARLLKSREGHYGHPNKVRYYGGVTQASMHDNASAESCEMLSAGSDGTLRHFNTALEQQNREMSSKVILDKLGMRRRNERLPQCLDFAFCETRQRDWGDLVTVHRNHSNAYVWRYKSRTITDMILRQPNWHNNDKMYSPDRRLFATTVGMSPCGNFAFVGHRSGDVFIYNLQSGLGRGSLPKSAADPYAVVKKGTIASRKATPANVLHSKDQVIQPTWTPMNPKGGGKGEGGDMDVTQGGEGWGNVGDNNNNSSDIDSEMRHTKEVRGIFVDLVQGVVVTCGLDGKVIFWDYHSHEALSHLQLDSPQTKLEGCRDAGFVAVVGLDRVVRVLDLSTQRLTRRFEGHSREVSDLAFTPDGRRLLTASTDCTVRVWDMPTGRCLAWLGFDAPIRSIAMSLSGEYLCVAQSGKEGVYMYLDRSLYESVQFWKEPTEPTAVRDAHVTLTDSADTAGTAYSTDPDKSSSSMGDDDGALAAGTEERGEIRAPQGQVVGSTVRESTEQRGLGSLTLSLLPRAYWTTLFNLELIKSRNKPKAPPAPKEAAPFFLPTVRKGGGVAASFPTPDEYAKIRSELSAATSGSGSGGGAKRAAASGEEDGDNDEHSEATASASTNKKSRKSKGGDTSSTSMEEEEERVMAELAAMGGAWDDDGADDDEWASPPKAVKEPATDQTPAAATSISSSSSRILSKAGKGKGGRKGQSPRTAMPRCKMTAFLLAETAEPSLVTAQNTSNNGTGNNNNNNGEEEEDDGPVVPKSKLLDYLKTLPPPAVDLELRALCNGADDEEGVALVARLLAWFVGRLRSGTDFEVLEAYLHRTLVIYADQMVSGGGGGGGSHYPPNGDIGGYSYPPGDAAATTSNLLLPLAQRVAKAHKAGLARLRTLIQGNLCLLKLLAKMPPM